MSRNGSGTYVLPAGNPVVTGTIITSIWANTTLADIATALTGSIAADGQTVVTGNIQMGNNKITGLAPATSPSDAVAYSQITNANIISGNINGAIIGNTNPQAGTFTNLAVTVAGTAPTMPSTDNSPNIATTAYVQSAIGSISAGVTSFNTRSGAVTLNQTDVENALATPLPVIKGGTGLAASGANGNILTSNGTAWTSAPAPVSIPSGVILMWSGTIATIPDGWLLCDGTAGTPNLLNRFIVGAGGSYTPTNIGGSADSALPSHSHSFSGNVGGNTGSALGSHSHTFSGTTAGMNANTTHSHGVSDPGHAHTFAQYITNNIRSGGPGPSPDPNQTTVSTNGSGTGISIAAANVDHGHTYSGTSSGVDLAHSHTMSGSVSGTTGNAGGSATGTNLPPYFALAYIMKS